MTDRGRQMIFNSLQFAAFLPIVLALYYLAGRARLQNPILALAGYVFYGFWDVRFLFLVSVSTALDYSTALMIANGRMSVAQRLQASGYAISAAFLFLVVNWGAIQLGSSGIAVDASRLLRREVWVWGSVLGTLVFIVVLQAFISFCVVLDERRRRKLFLGLSLVGQLGLLGVFKYYDFFADSAYSALHALGIEVSPLRLGLLLPVGISFYTFQTLSYVFDVYRGRVGAVARLPDFALYVMYFPPLVAGPIARAEHLVPQLLAERRVSLDLVSRGAFLILFGLFKKMTIADGMSPAVDSVFAASPHELSAFEIAAGSAAFAVQIYCDFSGYSDIARGSSFLLGITLNENFDLPYFSANPSEFWRRWHISLSSWLRDYLYVPLGGNRGSERRTRWNLMVTMVLGGLWHGAAWNYVLWGFYQGVLLVVHRGFRVATSAPSSDGGLFRRLPRIALMFVFVCFGWLLFRARSLTQIVELTGVLFGGPFLPIERKMHMPTATAVLGVAALALWEVAQFRAGTDVFYRRWPVPLRAFALATLLILAVTGGSNASREFIYFQF